PIGPVTRHKQIMAADRVFRKPTNPEEHAQRSFTASMPVELSITGLIERCKQGDTAAREQLFSRYRHYLWLIAQAQIGRHLRGKCDASDLVQQSLLEAHRDFGQFAGREETELLGWLRQILAHNLFNETRRFSTRQRDMAREVSLEQFRAGVDQSS